MMPAKVFISCGTMPGDELKAALAVKRWLEEQGFSARVAVTAQSLNDVNSGIIHELRTSDYYLFIDFQREPLRRWWQWLRPTTHRGSLYTHQELALAHCFGFEHCIFLQQNGVESRGIGQYLLTNPTKFKSHCDVLALVQQEVKNRQWTPNYTRHLCASKIVRATPLYQCFYAPSNRTEGIWHCFIENARREDAAIDVLARLNRLRDKNGGACKLADRSRLKWSLASGYDRTIFPEDREAFDAFAFDPECWTNVYLHSSRDVWPQQPIIMTPGTYFLDYQVFAKGFPCLEFTIQLEATGNDCTINASIV